MGLTLTISHGHFSSPISFTSQEGLLIVYCVSQHSSNNSQLTVGWHLTLKCSASLWIVILIPNCTFQKFFDGGRNGYVTHEQWFILWWDADKPNSRGDQWWNQTSLVCHQREAVSKQLTISFSLPNCKQGVVITFISSLLISLAKTTSQRISSICQLLTWAPIPIRPSLRQSMAYL